MDFWATKMPEGMPLRSPREASIIADPQAAITLETYEEVSGTKPEAPLPRETLVAYGRWFQLHLGSSLEEASVGSVRRDGSMFKATLDSGVSLTSHRVVIAAGIGPFQRKPAVFANLPTDLAPHCYEGRTVSELAGKRVAVIGAGQGALESVALLHEDGSVVEVIAKSRNFDG
jgi:FAD-dependent urate hydroxylase